MVDNVAVPALRRGRDPRLDVFRGLCLVMIYINHTPTTIYERFTSRNFGFSDAAEGFVLMSGMAAGLAYSPALRERLGWQGVGRIWARVWQLYVTHILVTALCLAVAAAGALWFHGEWFVNGPHLEKIYNMQLETQIGVVLLTHQIGYANILPLYTVLLAFAPFAIWLGWRKPGLLLALSVAIWAAAGIGRGLDLHPQLNLPNYPNPGGWFFNPVAWQLLFVLGLLTGINLRQGRRFVPLDGWLLGAAIAYLLAALVIVQAPGLMQRFSTALWGLNEYGAPWLLVSFDKTFLTAPRLLHILALAYVLSAFPAVRQAAASAIGRPFALLGRHSLQVFALGTILAFVGQVIKGDMVPSMALDTLILGTGIALMFLMAWARDRFRLPPTRPAQPAAPVPAVAPAVVRAAGGILSRT
jgi:hypothetical protein